MRLHLAAFIATSLIQVCLSAIYDINRNVIEGGENTDPNMHFPLLETAQNPGFSGVFTYERFQINNLGALNGRSTVCQGALIKTWDTITPNATELNWNAVGMLSGFCMGDFSVNAPSNGWKLGGYLKYSNGSDFLTNVRDKKGNATIRFNHFVDQPIVFNSTIQGLHYGTHKFYDALIIEFPHTNQDLINQFNPTFYDFAGSKDEIIRSPGIFVVSSRPSTSGNILPRLTSGTVAGFGQNFQGSNRFINEALRIYYANFINPGPIFSRKIENGIYVPDKLISFSQGYRELENTGSLLLALRPCFVDGVFILAMPNCLPEYKGRLLNAIFQLPFAKLNASYDEVVNITSGPFYSFDHVGLSDSKQQVLSTYSTLVDILVDSPNIDWPELPIDFDIVSK